MQRAKNYNKLNKTITINILNYNLTELEKYHSTYNFFEVEEKYRLTDLFEIHLIELKRFRDSECNKRLDVWAKFLIDPNSEEMEVIAMENEMIQKAKKELDYLSSDYETVRLAELREKAIMDYNTGIEGAREEGEFKKAIEIATNLLDVLDDDMIAIKTGLSIEEVRKQREKQKNS